MQDVRFMNMVGYISNQLIPNRTYASIDLIPLHTHSIHTIWMRDSEWQTQKFSTYVSHVSIDDQHMHKNNSKIPKNRATLKLKRFQLYLNIKNGLILNV